VVAAGHPQLGGRPADIAAFRRFRLLEAVAESCFLAGAGDRPPPPGVRIFQPFGPAEFLAEAWAGFDAGDFTQQDLNLLDRLGALLGGLAPQVVHLHDLAPFGVEFVALIRRLCPGARIVMTLGPEFAQRAGITGAPEGEPVPRFLRAALLRHALREATLLVPSESLRRACVDFGLDPARLLVRAELPPAAEPRDPPPARHFLVAAAFPDPDGLATLAAAAELLAALPPPEGRRLRLEVHGVGEGTPAGPGLALRPADGPEAVAAAHLVLVPRGDDPRGIAAMAGAQGRPVLEYDSAAGLAEGLFALLESPAALAALQADLTPPPDAAQLAADALAFYRGLPA